MVLAGSEQLVQRCEEAIVLVAGAVGHAPPALLAERPAGPNDHAALREPAHDLVLVTVADRDPGEVRLAVGGLEAALLQLRLNVHSLDRGLLHATLQLVHVVESL